jgi:hypothetical protein
LFGSDRDSNPKSSWNKQKAKPPSIPPIVSKIRASRISPKAIPMDKDSLCRRSRPGDCCQKESLIKELFNQCISKVVASFYFYELQKKKCNLFYDQDPMGFFPIPCMPSTNSRTFMILFASVSLFLLFFLSVQTMRFSERQLLASIPMIRIHGHRCCPA